MDPLPPVPEAGSSSSAERGSASKAAPAALVEPRHKRELPACPRLFNLLTNQADTSAPTCCFVSRSPAAQITLTCCVVTRELLLLEVNGEVNWETLNLHKPNKPQRVCAPSAAHAPFFLEVPTPNQSLSHQALSSLPTPKLPALFSARESHDAGWLFGTPLLAVSRDDTKARAAF